MRFLCRVIPGGLSQLDPVWRSVSARQGLDITIRADLRKEEQRERHQQEEAEVCFYSNI